MIERELCKELKLTTVIMSTTKITLLTLVAVLVKYSPFDHR